MKAVTAAVGAHCAAVGCGLALALRPPLEKPARGNEDPAVAVDPDRLSRVEKTLSAMYTAGKSGPLCRDQFQEICTFEDPAASCEGFEEIAEAFRALAFLNPEPISRRLASAEEPDLMTFDSRQRYIIAGRPIELVSTLVVRADDTGRLSSIQELWHHHPLLPPLSLTRRLNGIVSFQLTKRLL